MARRSDPAKVAQWTTCLARFQDSGMSVAGFCKQEGVSVASFYQWRRKLSERDESGRQVARQSSARSPIGSGFQSVQVLPAASAATIRLPNGVEIELGSDLRAFDLLARRLLDGAQNGKDGRPC